MTKPLRWHGIVNLPHGELLLLDGVRLRMIRIDSQGQAIGVGDLIWDHIRPPPDGGGEAPADEVRKLRARFARAYLKAGGALKMVGLAPLRSTKSYQYYLTASRIPDFPLLTLRCPHSDPSRCRVERSCELIPREPRAAFLGADARRVGIAYYPNERLLILGDQKAHELRLFRFGSCLHVPEQGRRKLPIKLKKIGGIHGSADGGLWIATLTKDDYLNASVFYWPAGSW